MLFAILNYLRDHSGAPITEIRRHFDLPSEMIARWMIEFEDAGWVTSPPLTQCHHLEADAGCGSCGSGSCASGGEAACSNEGAFERGCCGMNGPYRLTEAGARFLDRMSAA